MTKEEFRNKSTQLARKYYDEQQNLEREFIKENQKATKDDILYCKEVKKYFKVKWVELDRWKLELVYHCFRVKKDGGMFKQIHELSISHDNIDDLFQLVKND